MIHLFHQLTHQIFDKSKRLKSNYETRNIDSDSKKVRMKRIHK